MLTVVVAQRANDAESIRLPLTSPIIVGDETPTPIDDGQGSQGVIRFVRNESRPGMAEEIKGYFPPLVYVYESVRQTSQYVMTPSSIGEEVRTVRQQKFVSYFIPRDLNGAALAVGEIVHVKKGFRVLCDGLSGRGYQAPFFEPVEFDIPKVKADLPDDQWFRRVRRMGNVKDVTIYGDNIEQDGLYATLDSNSEENEVGITF